MLDRERLHNVPRVVECRVPLKLSREGKTQTLVFSLTPNTESNRQALEILQAVGVANPNVTDFSSQVEFNGRFKISWYVKAFSESGKIAVVYGVQLPRPDNTITYALRTAKQPEFYNGPHYGYSWGKDRTRVDALPVWVRVEEWDKEMLEPGDISPEPYKVTLFATGLEEQSFEVDPNNSAFLRQTHEFVGSWKEQWNWKQVNEQLKLSDVNVTFKGSWEHPSK